MYYSLLCDIGILLILVSIVCEAWQLACIHD